MPISRRVVIAQNDEMYLSFPDVVQAGDGRLVLVYREADAHVATRSRLVLADSHDQGRTWVNRRYLDAPLTLSTDGAVWNCPRIVAQRDGGLTILCDLSQTPPGATAPVPESQRRFRTFIWRSFDHGRSWSTRRPTRIQGLVPDRLLELSGDTWMVGSHYHSLRHFGTLTQVATFTHDAGETWTTVSIVAEVPGMQFCEGSVARCPGGQLVCYLRENSIAGCPRASAFRLTGASLDEPEPAGSGHRPVAACGRRGKMLVTYRDVAWRDPDARRRSVACIPPLLLAGDPQDEKHGRCLTIELDTSGCSGTTATPVGPNSPRAACSAPIQPGRSPPSRMSWGGAELVPGGATSASRPPDRRHAVGSGPLPLFGAGRRVDLRGLVQVRLPAQMHAGELTRRLEAVLRGQPAGVLVGQGMVEGDLALGGGGNAPAQQRITRLGRVRHERGQVFVEVPMSAQDEAIHHAASPMDGGQFRPPGRQAAEHFASIDAIRGAIQRVDGV